MQVTVGREGTDLPTLGHRRPSSGCGTQSCAHFSVCPVTPVAGYLGMHFRGERIGVLLRA